MKKDVIVSFTSTFSLTILWGHVTCYFPASWGPLKGECQNDYAKAKEDIKLSEILSRLSAQEEGCIIEDQTEFFSRESVCYCCNSHVMLVVFSMNVGLSILLTISSFWWLSKGATTEK